MKIKIKKSAGFLCIAVIIVIGVTISIFYNISNSQDSYNVDDNQITCYYNSFSVQFATEDGFYYSSGSNFLHFYDFESQQDTIVCSKINCKHQEWNDDTPDEQRCDAYFPSVSVGFTANDKLYIISSSTDTIPGTFAITSSDLDRSNQTETAKFESDLISTMAVSDDLLYVTGSIYVYEKDENGSDVPSGKTKPSFSTVDLNNGKAVEIFQSKSGYGADLSIIGANGDTVFLSYSYFEEQYDGTNYDEAKYHSKIYTYDTQNQVIDELSVDEDARLIFNHVYGNKIIGYSFNSDDTQNEIVLYDTETEKSETVGYSQTTPQYIDEYIIYQESDEYYMYNIEKGTSDSMDNYFISGFYIQEDTGEYIFASVATTEQQDDVVLITKKDFYKNNPNYIYLNFYNE